LTTLSAAFWNYDRTQPILDGRVAVEGCRLECTVLRPEEAFARAFTDAPFDVTELSYSNTITAVSKGDFAYWLIPVFPSRAFRHSAIFIRTDRGIRSPADLAGRTVGLQEYDMTAAVVARGMLRDEYGVDTRSIHWRAGEKERTKALAFPVPRKPPELDLEILPPGRSLEDRLLAGELDALISLRAPAPDSRVARLFADPAAEERAYFRRSGIFPIMHAIGVRKSVSPGLASKLYDAFLKAKQLAVAELEIIQAAKVTLPWVNDELRRTRELMGEDYWPYGLEANRKVLEAQLRWSREDGLQARTVSLAELFAPGMVSTDAAQRLTQVQRGAPQSSHAGGSPCAAQD
jgi:4,5-dihydroxyphthalate decarboxylase